MRGRYMAIFGFSWTIPSAIGPYLAGLVMDNGDPDVVWYLAGLGGLIGIVGFLTLHRIFTAKDRVTTIEAAEAIEQSSADAPDGIVPAIA
jgi:MFS family permease